MFLDGLFRRRLHAATMVLCVGVPLTLAAQTGGTSNWLQWGGAHRNFVSDVKGLASTWPPGGPKRLWSRELGDGHSAIAAEGGLLYTLYRPAARGPAQVEQVEIVTALDASTGATIWQFRYAASTASMNYEYGVGPHSTPLVTASRVYATSSRAELFALDKKTGTKIWSHDLVKEYGAPLFQRGYSGSPLLYKGNVIVPIGGVGQTLAAFSAETGKLVWRGGSCDYAPASPIQIDVDGQAQIVMLGGDCVVGVDAATGKSQWSHPHRTDFGLNISTPVWSPDHLLFLSSAYGTGSRALELHQSAGKTSVEERWANNRMRVHIGTVIRIGDHAYGSSGDFGPAFITAVDMKTGAVAWQDRSFARAQLLYADGKLIVLDEDGVLALATVSPAGLKVLARASVLSHLAWTPPTLAGTKLYVRDRKTLGAYELGAF
jgi:outer membrane protein assembly factor BamB